MHTTKGADDPAQLWPSNTWAQSELFSFRYSLVQLLCTTYKNCSQTRENFHATALVITSSLHHCYPLLIQTNNMVPPPPPLMNSTYSIPPEYLAALLAAQAQQSHMTVDRPRGLSQPQTAPSSKPSTSHQKNFLTSRQQCLLFIKVLLRYLAKADIVPLQKRVKHVLAKCIRRNQQDKSTDLADLVEEEVRRCIGEIHWARAQRCYISVCAKQGFQFTSASHVEAV